MAERDGLDGHRSERGGAVASVARVASVADGVGCASPGVLRPFQPRSRVAKLGAQAGWEVPGPPPSAASSTPHRPSRMRRDVCWPRPNEA